MIRLIQIAPMQIACQYGAMGRTRPLKPMGLRDTSRAMSQPKPAQTAPLEPGLVRVGGAPEGFDASLLADLVRRTDGPVIHIANDDTRMASMVDGLRVFGPSIPILRFPAWDCLPYDRVSPNTEILAQRLATLAALSRNWVRPSVILTSMNAAMQRIPAREIIKEASFTARAGSRIDPDALMRYLGRNGYTRSSTVVEPGDFAVRGGIIDIFPPGRAKPLRLDFFGDVLETIKRFDPATQLSADRVDRLALAPVSETPLTDEIIERFRRGYREMFGAAGSEDALYEAVSRGGRHQGMEHWLPLFHERLDTLFDYLPEAPVSFDAQVEDIRAGRWDTVLDHYETRKAAQDERTMGAPVYKPIPPAMLYLDEQAWAEALTARPLRAFSPLPTGSGPNTIDAGGKLGRSFAAERQAEGKSESTNLFDAVVGHIESRIADKKRVVIASYSDGSRDRMATLLKDHGLGTTATVARWSEITALPKGTVALIVWRLESGFETPKLAVVAEQDILGDRLVRQTRKRRTAENFLTEASSLSTGDLVIHVEHGLGRYVGLQTVEALGAPHDCLTIDYANDARLLLPVENIELLSRYGDNENAQLDRLGGGGWQARKAKMKNRIKDMAERLIRIAAERQLRKSPVITPPEGVWEEFCARFPYTETDDQMAAIEDVISDIGSGRPMDRLVVGDVGFGKTEVAIRAAFAASMEGFQVAVIAPTTLLARQHAKNFAERFRGLPLKVRQLSRFVPAKEAAATREGLTDGTVDIVIGTHALLAKGIKFANLGLLVVDEEQHFGVRHKERLKALKSDVHVLTMTATPIPRTLQLAMTGVREMSLIATPPVDRLSIRTYVAPFDPVTIREALLREHYRGGQSFYVVPRISDLPDIEEFLREQLPEVKFATAHGQMAPGALDDVMNAFYDGQFDVLLATTIVESGLDIPTANTLIVHRADMFGLAQLYQIRGRVGRSKTRAYAYFTTKPRKPLTPQAEKRLKVLASLDTLGAGFNLASHDLDLRGAGNLLGEEQSGQIKEVGYELYQDMLEEALAKMRSGEIDAPDEGGTWSPQINLGVPVLLPEAYIADLDVRLGLYRRLSSLATREELEGFAAELHDRFGKPPSEVESLLAIVRIKAMCRRAGIAKLDGGPKGATVQFRNDKFANPAGLAQWIAGQNNLAKVKGTKLVVRRDWDDDAAKMKGAFAICRDLAKVAEAEPVKA